MNNAMLILNLSLIFYANIIVYFIISATFDDNQNLHLLLAIVMSVQISGMTILGILFIELFCCITMFAFCKAFKTHVFMHYLIKEITYFIV